MTQRPNATYQCTVCGETWSYEAVRYLACCRDCGSGLVRTVCVADAGVATEESRAGRRQYPAVSGRQHVAKPIAL